MNRSGVPEPRIEYAPKHYICRRAGQPLVLDGRVDKAFGMRRNGPTISLISKGIFARSRPNGPGSKCCGMTTIFIFSPN